jgi:hypothetical protein
LSGQGSANYAVKLMSDLNSGSKVAIWRLLIWINAFSVWTLEKLFDTHKAEVTDLANAAIAGNDAWLVNQAKLFELGNTTLTVSGEMRAVYAVSDPANRIITLAGISRENGRAVLKVLKGESPAEVPLSDSELTAFRSYINRIKFAGTRLAVVSRPVDVFRVTVSQLFYNGVYDPTNVAENMVYALIAYIEALPFNGAFAVNKAVQVMMEADGVVNFEITFFFHNNSTGVDTPIPEPFFYPKSGKLYCENFTVENSIPI